MDEETAAVVRHIFDLCAAGQDPSQIARLLKREQVLCPTTCAYKTFGVAHNSLNLNNPYGWSNSTIANMLENTNPALVSLEAWDIVQRVRQRKRRPTKMEEQNKYSGLVV